MTSNSCLADPLVWFGTCRELCEISEKHQNAMETYHHHLTSAIFFGPLNDGPGIFDPLNDGPEIFLTKRHKSPQRPQPTSVPRYNLPLAT